MKKSTTRLTTIPPKTSKLNGEQRRRAHQPTNKEQMTAAAAMRMRKSKYQATTKTAITTIDNDDENLMTFSSNGELFSQTPSKATTNKIVYRSFEKRQADKPKTNICQFYFDEKYMAIVLSEYLGEKKHFLGSSLGRGEFTNISSRDNCKGTKK